MSSFNAIIVGGQFGVYGHTAALSLCPEIKIKGVYSSNEKNTSSLHEKLNIPHKYQTYEQALGSTDIDLVFIAVPPQAQFNLARLAFQHRKKVFLEKPLAVNLELAENLVQLAQENNIATCINFELIELPSLVFLKDLISKIPASEILHFNLDWRLPSHAFLTNKKSWKTQPHEGGGFLKHYCSHIFHLLEWFFNEDYGSDTLVTDRLDLGGSLVQSRLKFASGLTGQFGGTCASYANTGLTFEIYTRTATYRLINVSQNLIYGYKIICTTASTEQTLYQDTNSIVPSHLDARALPVSKLIQKFIKNVDVPNILDGLKAQKHLEAAHYE